MARWIIAPFYSDRTKKIFCDLYDAYWKQGLEEGFISIGWDVRESDCASKTLIYKRLGLTAGSGSRDAGTIYRFMKEIDVGDIIVARRGKGHVMGIGTVTRAGYEDKNKCRHIYLHFRDRFRNERGQEYSDHHKLFIDVAWNASFRDRDLSDKHTFTRTTVYTPNENNLPSWLIGAIKRQESGQAQFVDDLGVVDQAMRSGLMETEGRRLARQHYAYERSRKNADRKKKEARYICEACGLHFGSVYGQMFERILHVHHLIPLSKLNGKDRGRPTLEDLAALCPNCHAMIHRYPGTGGRKDLVKLRRNIRLRRA